MRFALQLAGVPFAQMLDLAQMADVAQQRACSVLAVQQVPRAQTGSYGIVATDAFAERCGRITGIVEKPDPGVAPSTLAVVGRYILDARIFALLETTRPGKGGEIQLTDAIAALLGEQVVNAYHFHGTRFDCGTHIGLIEATIRQVESGDFIPPRQRAPHVAHLRRSARLPARRFHLRPWLPKGTRRRSAGLGSHIPPGGNSPFK